MLHFLHHYNLQASFNTMCENVFSHIIVRCPVLYIIRSYPEEINCFVVLTCLFSCRELGWNASQGLEAILNLFKCAIEHK